MSLHYTDEKNIQILISLMKQHGIKKMVVSPGTQNFSFVGSIQKDNFFEIYSAPDERSAAYIACGMSAESGEIVGLSCTGATASRNYVPGLTEAFYRKLPVLAITFSKHHAYIGQNYPQILDRTKSQADIVTKSINVPIIESKDDEWGAVVSINDALLSLRHKGCNPVHINIETKGSSIFSSTELKRYRMIERVSYGDSFPIIPQEQNIAIFIGAHSIIDENLTKSIETFCEQHNGVVLCDHTSNYSGNYKIYPSLITSQHNYKPKNLEIDLLVYIGNISGAYIQLRAKETWRVNPDGIIRDTYRSTRYVFEMEEIDFFNHYSEEFQSKCIMNFYDEWKREDRDIRSNIPELPFSNIWISSQLAEKLKEGECVHLGILNSLRSMNFFLPSHNISCFCNTGGFGIDGPVSTVLGGALARPQIIHYLIVGDLAFFYDMNVLGNRHFPKNVRILLVNNGVGTEFKHYSHKASVLGNDVDPFIAARGHYGNKSKDLVKHYAEDLGFLYIAANSKDEFRESFAQFTADSMEMPVIFEVFTDSENESDSLKRMNTIKSSVDSSTKSFVKQVVGQNNINRIKKLIKK